MQVSSATATFVMIFSSSMSVVQYYLLGRFPVPYGKENLKIFIGFYCCQLSDDISSSSLVFFSFLHHSIFFLHLAALYFVAVATVAALAGQYVVRKIISIVGRASVIIFVLAFTIFVSALSLGKFLLFSFCLHLKKKKVCLHVLSYSKLSLSINYDSFLDQLCN